MTTGLARRATVALGLLLLGFGLFVAALVQHVGRQHEAASLQLQAHGLAQHIVQRWPEVQAAATASPTPAAVRTADADAGRSHNGHTDADTRQALLRMLMTVNPGIQVYLLDAQGRVAHYIGEPGMVRQHQVDLHTVRRFLAGAPVPLRGTDPMGGPARPFSAAMFPPAPGQTTAPGYLYVVLGALPAATAATAATNSTTTADSQGRAWFGLPAWRSVAGALASGLGLGLVATLLAGALVMRRLTLPLHRLAQRMAAFQLPRSGMADETPPLAADRANISAAAAPPPPVAPQAQGADEVAAIGQAFELMSARIHQQAQQREAQAAAHREVMAGVAHDLRTPLTALHGHLEAAHALPALPPACTPHLAAALAQSNTLRRLTQQLFELALLQATRELPLREPFRLDELLSDTVLKFHPGSARPGVALLLPAAEPVCLEGDLHLIERALSNLIDNAVRHAPGSSPVRVSLQRDTAQVRVLVEDQGPGLPQDLAQRLDAGQPVRELLSQRPGGRSGGLGLAIAQRIAQLHGGSLRTVPGPPGGARLALALPLPTA